MHALALQKRPQHFVADVRHILLLINYSGEMHAVKKEVQSRGCYIVVSERIPKEHKVQPIINELR